MGDDLDPFGRRKDENPLASLGWHGEETASTAEPEPEREPARESGPPPSLAEPDASAAHRRSAPRHDHTPLSAPAQRRPVGRIVRAVIVLGIVVAVLAGLIGALVDEGVERADRFAREFTPPDVQVPAVPGDGDDGARTERPERPDRPARGLSANSLLRPAAFGRAMTRLRTGGHGRLTHLRVAPERIDATTVTKAGRLKLLQIVPGGAVNVLQTTGGFAGAQTMTLKGIDPGAPSRLTRSAAGRLKQPASRVDYLVLSEFAGARQWNVYFKGGAIFSADSRGRITRRIS